MGLNLNCFWFVLVTVALCNPAYSQYPDVHEEAHHKIVFSDAQFRFLRVSGKIGDTTLYHFHRNPICYLTIAGTRVWLDARDSEPRTATLPTGWVGGEHYTQDSEFIHRFAVIDSVPLLLIGIEYIGTAPQETAKLPNEPIYQENGFEVFKMTWEEFIELPNSQHLTPVLASGVIVLPALPNGHSGIKKLNPGAVITPSEMAVKDHITSENAEIWLVQFMAPELPSGKKNTE